MDISRYDEYRHLYDRHTPTLERFAAERGVTLRYVSSDEDPWVGPHYHLGWVNGLGQTCYMTLALDRGAPGTPGKLQLDLLRWDAQGLAARRGWELPADADEAALESALGGAMAWSNQGPS